MDSYIFSIYHNQYRRVLMWCNAAIWCKGDCCKVINWEDDLPYLLASPVWVIGCYIDDIRKALPVAVQTNRDPDYGDWIEITRGSISGIDEDKILALFGVRRIDRDNICVDDVEPISGTVLMFNTGVWVVIPDTWI